MNENKHVVIGPPLELVPTLVGRGWGAKRGLSKIQSLSIIYLNKDKFIVGLNPQAGMMEIKVNDILTL